MKEPKHLKLEGIGKSLSKIKAKYGVFASTGNHEFINGINGTSKFITENGINLIRDSSLFIADSFIVAAREDGSKNNFTGERKKIADRNNEYELTKIILLFYWIILHLSLKKLKQMA